MKEATIHVSYILLALVVAEVSMFAGDLAGRTARKHGKTVSVGSSILHIIGSVALAAAIALAAFLTCFD